MKSITLNIVSSSEAGWGRFLATYSKAINDYLDNDMGVRLMGDNIVWHAYTILAARAGVCPQTVRNHHRRAIRVPHVRTMTAILFACEYEEIVLRNGAAAVTKRRRRKVTVAR